nr:uncharacterized protein LOC121126478 [Lepeophtheirus salmonis]
MVGKVRKNKPELPPALHHKREKSSHQNLRTLHRDGSISDRDDRRPIIIMDYNRNKGYVDNLDMVIGAYSCRRISTSTFKNSFPIFTKLIETSSTGRTLVRLQKAEQYGLCLCLGLVEEGREPWSLTRSEVCVRVRDLIIKSRFSPTKFWFSVVPTLPFTSLDNGCETVSPLDHPKLDKGTSSKIDMSPRDER